MNIELNKKTNSEKLRDILKGSNKGNDYTENQLFVLEGAIYGNNPNIVLKITNGNGVYIDGYVTLLRNAFKKVISKAFNEDENNRYRILKLSYEKDELLRQNTILSKQINQTPSSSSNENLYKEKLSALERQLSKAKNNYEKLQNKYQKDISERDEKIEDLLSKNKMCEAALESYKSAILCVLLTYPHLSSQVNKPTPNESIIDYPIGDFEVTNNQREKEKKPVEIDDTKIKFAGYGKYTVSADNPNIELKNPEGNFVDMVFTLKDKASGEIIARTGKVSAGGYVYVNVIDFYTETGTYDVQISISTSDSDSGQQMNGLNQEMQIMVK